MRIFFCNAQVMPFETPLAMGEMAGEFSWGAWEMAGGSARRTLGVEGSNLGANSYPVLAYPCHPVPLGYPFGQ